MIEGQTRYGEEWILDAGIGTATIVGDNPSINVEDLREIVRVYDEAGRMQE